MIIHTAQKSYVAELKAPSYWYLGKEIRGEIPEPAGFEINRGYWILRPQEEEPELDLVVEFVATTLKDAEDHALKVGRILSSIASAHGGYPIGVPKLQRAASVNLDGYLMSQHQYWYGDKSQKLWPYDEHARQTFQKNLKLISLMDSKEKYRLLAAIHWYGISISADDPTVSYVAAWTGLEIIGSFVNSIFHPKGSGAPCQICKNKAGKDRDRKKAGIEHAFLYLAKEYLPESPSEGNREQIADDLVKGFTSERARKLRNSVVHGLEEFEVLLEKCSEVRRHLIHVLNVSILTAMASSASARVTGHYEFHPDGRVSLKLSQVLPKSPFLNEWIEGFQYPAEPGNFGKDRLFVATDGVEWRVPNGISKLIESTSSEKFIRDLDIFNLGDEPVVTECVTWHERPLEPEWENSLQWIFEEDEGTPS